MLTSVSVAAV